MGRRRKHTEVKLKEDVSANVIPMVDIMFLLVLFFMLAADMAEKDLEVVQLPYAEKAIDEKKSDADVNPKEKRPTVNVYHGEVDPPCSSYSSNPKSDLVCRNQAHWFYTLKKVHYNYEMENVDDILQNKKPVRKLEDQLREFRIEWDNENGRKNDPATSLKPSEMPLMIRADRAAPFGYIQRVMGICGKVLVYKVTVGASLESDSGPKK